MASVDDVADAASKFVALLDELKPDDLTAEDCVRVIALCTKEPQQAVTRVIKDVVGLLELRLAQLVPKKHTAPIAGYEVKHRSGSPKRTEWQKDDLLRVVLDSRRIDLETMEMIEETQADKLMHVFGLGNPKVTALKERGIKADDFCKVTREDRVEVV